MKRPDLILASRSRALGTDSKTAFAGGFWGGGGRALRLLLTCGTRCGPRGCAGVLCGQLWAGAGPGTKRRRSGVRLVQRPKTKEVPPHRPASALRCCAFPEGQGCIGRGGGNPPLEGAQPMPLSP